MKCLQKCKKKINWYDNVPIFSYLLLGGSSGTVITSDYDSITGGYVWVKSGENQFANTIQTFYTSAAVKYGELSNSGLALGSATINSATQLDLQATDKGLGLNLVAGNLGTTRNGNIWYDSTANVCKGIVNSAVETFLTVGALVTSSAATLTLSHRVDYVFTGTTTTWTLPAVNASVTGRANAIIIKNRGTGNITLNTNGGSNVLFTSSLVNTLTISVGDSVTLISDGTYFNVI